MDKKKLKTGVKDTARIYLQHTKKYRWWVLTIFISLICANVASLLKPLLYRQFFDILASNASHDINQLLLIVAQTLFLGVLVWAFWRITIFIDIDVAARILSDLLNTSFKYIHGHSYNYFNNNFSGSLVRRVNRFSQSYENIQDQIIYNISPTIISITVIMIVLAKRSWILVAVILVWTIIYILLSYLFVRYKLKYDLTRAETDSDLTGHLSDTIINHLNLKLFSSAKNEYLTFKKHTRKLTEDRLKTWNLDNYAEAAQGALMLILEFAVMYIAVLGWKKGLLTVGDFALIQAYLLNIFDNIWGVGRFMRKIYSNFADAQEMTEALLTPHEVVDTPNAKRLVVTRGDIQFKSVKFAYNEDKELISELNIHVTPGERLALIGPSGGGKSTVVKLLLRFFDLKDGSIIIDGQNVSMVTQASLRDQISFVPQESVLFHRSLKENIKYACPNATDEQVVDAAKLAHCHEFIDQLPEKYETYVGERGVKLSGGERQRVAIARAILKNAPILVLDEATSSLDSESEHFIQSAMKNLMKGKTTIVIAHRLSTIMQMDRILVIDGGKIIEEGTHHNLLEVEQGTYQKLWEIQAGGFGQTS